MNYDSEMLGLHAEKIHIVNKDGAFTEHETKRLEVLSQIFSAEPPLQELLIALDVRQRNETAALIEQQTQARNSSEGDADSYARFQSEHLEMERRHDQERDRYVRDHHKANDLRREMNEKQQSLAPDGERKFTP